MARKLFRDSEGTARCFKAWLVGCGFRNIDNATFHFSRAAVSHRLGDDIYVHLVQSISVLRMRTSISVYVVLLDGPLGVQTLQ